MSIATELDALARSLAKRLQETGEKPPSLDHVISGFKALTMYQQGLTKRVKASPADDEDQEDDTETTMDDIRKTIRAVK